jgi:hypothetical protein
MVASVIPDAKPGDKNGNVAELPAIEKVHAALVKVATTKSPDAAMAVLKKFGSSKLSTLDKVYYFAVLTECENMVVAK